LNIDDLREIAIAHGIVILDYESIDTLRSRQAQFDGCDLDAVPNAKLAAVMGRLDSFYREDFPLLTDYDDANAIIDKAFRNALMDKGVLTDDRGSETGNRKPETGNRKPETNKSWRNASGKWGHSLQRFMQA
jgi:hypothetical protein